MRRTIGKEQIRKQITEKEDENPKIVWAKLIRSTLFLRSMIENVQCR